jgi:hypothetical protein
VLDAVVGQHLVDGEAEAEPSDEDGARVPDLVERGPRQRDLAAGLAVVHDEHAVHPELQDHGGAFGCLEVPPLAEDDLAALGGGAGHLDVLDGVHAAIMPSDPRPPSRRSG